MKLTRQVRPGSSKLTNCTVCEGTNIHFSFFKNEYGILNCRDCDHLFTDLIMTPQKVNEIYSDDYFFGGGDGYDDYTLQGKMLTGRGEYYADKLGSYMVPGKVLDIGSAAGFLLKGFENKGWQGTGIEPNASMAEYGRTVVGLDIKKGTLVSVKLNDKYDLIIVIQVIGHIDNLKNSIDQMSGYLKPGGHILIETWNKDSITAKIFGKSWHEFSPPSTLNYFSKKSLKEVMRQQNFSLVGQGTPKKKINSGHARSFIKHKLRDSKKLRWMAGITSLIPGNVNLPYPSEDLFWYLFKKNQAKRYFSELEGYDIALEEKKVVSTYKKMPN
ncbi:MAG: class I SAM-dependent methyltransferase [Ferruginibacter sp.]